MERGSDKVPPRIDEQLEQATGPLERGAPVTSRAQEHREQESAGDDESAVDSRPGMGAAEARGELARHLQPSAFPADRDGLLASAREMNAPDGVLSLLDEVPEGRRFNTVQDVWEALGLPEPR